VDYGCVYETSTDVYLVAQAGSCLSSCINQGNLAITDRDTPAWRPSDVDVDQPVADVDQPVAGADYSADCHANYQAICRRIDPECSDQLSLHCDGWNFALNGEAGQPTTVLRPPRANQRTFSTGPEFRTCR
jgi:hypothetical protein